jgi:hypothetical protein
MKKWAGILLLLSCRLFSQNAPPKDTTDGVVVPIQLDRPDQTECPFITPEKYIQIESGFNYEYATDLEQNYSYPSSLWKYGINKKVELRLITELISAKLYTTVTSGLNPITVGFKTALLEEKGIIPKTSFIGHITTAQVGTKDFHTKYVAPSFRFTMQHTVTKRISLAYNLGMEWDGNTAAHTYIYTLTTGISITERLGCYAELYGFLPDNSIPDHRCDGGFTFLVNNDLMVDLSGGFGITENSPDNYLSLGISYRFRLLH